jgi:hypothetical protein
VLADNLIRSMNCCVGRIAPKGYSSDAQIPEQTAFSPGQRFLWTRCPISDGTSILGPLPQRGLDHHLLSIADEGQLDLLPNLGLGVKVHCQIPARLELLLIDREQYVSPDRETEPAKIYHSVATPNASLVSRPARHRCDDQQSPVDADIHTTLTEELCCHGR